MIRVFFNFVLFFLLTSFVAANDGHAADKDHPWYVSGKDFSHARKALSMAKKQRWSQTMTFAKKAKDPLIPKIFLWMQYTSGSKHSTFEELSEFVKTNTHWPRMPILKRRTEEAMRITTPPDEVIEWFTKRKSWMGKDYFKQPITSKGKQLFAESLLKSKDKIDVDIPGAYKMIRESWIETNFGTKEESDFLKKHNDILRQEDHAERIDRLLWDERTTSAKRILRKVGAEKRKLYEARIGLIRSSWGVDKLVKAVPEKYRGDQGLLYDRLKWRAKRGRDEGVAELLNYVHPNPKHPKRWWKYKSRQIQREIAKKDYKKAYKLATYHGLTSGIEFAEAEWLSGWIALRFLNDPKAAYRHFYNLHQGVVTPISLARGAYWSGRAAEENENLDIAQSWYAAASSFPTTFYGQMAIRKLGKKIMSFPKQPSPTSKDIDNYHNNELVKAAYILHGLDRPGTVKLFLKAATKAAKSVGEIALISKLGKELKRPDYGIEVAREVSKSGLILTDAHYPRLPKIKNARTKREVTKPEKGLFHAIIMQESAFHQKAISSKGARGLMQLMPATAKSVARKLRFRYNRGSLTSNASYNVTLGSRYIEDVIKSWDGSYILGIASYNAGPSNARKWVKRNGDPREFEDIEEIIDWIEHIPFAETRNYVQRVLENLQVYRYLLGDNKNPYTYIIEDLKR